MKFRFRYRPRTNEWFRAWRRSDGAVSMRGPYPSWRAARGYDYAMPFIIIGGDTV